MAVEQCVGVGWVHIMPVSIHCLLLFFLIKQTELTVVTQESTNNHNTIIQPFMAQ